ncbi:uncharacterized protein TNCV_3839501 [Trichonephila clavipes]|nr:uncharacterized protein TNCV_3839501 [Trichonephila clavipes]
MRSVVQSPPVAEQCDVNIHSLTRASTIENPPCRETMHVKSIESSNVLPLVIMKVLSIAVFAVMAAAAHAITFSCLATVSLTLISLHKPASAFFGFFRRRSPKPSIIEEMSPEGPVDFSSFNIPQRSGLLAPFSGMNRGGFFPGFNGIPGFPGGQFLNQFIPGLPQPNWPPFQNVPRPGQFQPQKPQPGQFQPQNIAQKPQPGQFQPSSIPQPGQFLPQNIQSQQFSSHDFDQNPDFQSDSDREVRFEDQPQINTEEAESFFTLLAETDENKCISRLVCEMGANPSSAGELGTTITEIIGSLRDFPEGSKVMEYNKVLQGGITEGIDSCQSRYSACDEESYELMKTSQTEDAATSA